ncbi:MAG: hypothetical protein KGL39_51940 [Patescibacteria group bacterium]|nr:hypothetical protein [Patescibacteria group bacterium]
MKQPLNDGWLPDRIVAYRNPQSTAIKGHWRHDGQGPGDDLYLRATPALLALVEAAIACGQDFGPDEEDRLQDAVIAYARSVREAK